jgi:predicted transposase/invertase (TIGR01784 family)
MPRLSPLVDIAFKKIFGVDENKDLLISLINSIVSKEDQVEDLTILNPYNPKNFEKDKLSILDIKAKGFNGKLFNVEIQLCDEKDYEKRALFYWSELYSGQLGVGVPYSSLEKAIGIHILNFNVIPEGYSREGKYHHRFRSQEVEDGFFYFDDFELHTIELKKFSKDPKEELGDLMVRIKQSLDMWVAFLTRNYLLDKQALPDPLNAVPIQKALDVLDVMSLTDDEREVYKGKMKWLRMEESALKKAEEKGEKRGIKKGEKVGLEKGIEKGMKKGEKIGLEKGLEKGIEKGIKQGEKVGLEKGKIEAKLEVARALLQEGFDLAKIKGLTGLGEDVISSLTKNLG